MDGLCLFLSIGQAFYPYFATKVSSALVAKCQRRAAPALAHDAWHTDERLCRGSQAMPPPSLRRSDIEIGVQWLQAMQRHFTVRNNVLLI